MAEQPRTTNGDRLRMGGMALENGLLVYGPKHWAAAVRTRGGAVKVQSGRVPRVGGPLNHVPAPAARPPLHRPIPEILDDQDLIGLVLGVRSRHRARSVQDFAATIANLAAAATFEAVRPKCS